MLLRHTRNMKTKKLEQILFFLALLTIMTVSIFIMIHAKEINIKYQNHYIKQTLFFLISIILFISKDKIKINVLFEYSNHIYLLNVFLLFLVLIMGSTVNGAKAWFHLGFFSFQPSELMKLSLLLYLCQMKRNQELNNKKEERNYIIKVFSAFLLPSLLVFLEPDTGAIIFYFLIMISVLISSKISKKWLLFFGIAIITLLISFFYLYFFQEDILISLIGTSFFYRVERLLNFQKGLQIENALIAIGSAPFFKWNLTETGIYIPEAPTDFAFTLVTNVLGIFGLLLVLLSYTIITVILIKTIPKQKKEPLYSFHISFLVIFLFNTFYNIFMNIGCVPIMGIPLPFLSYGGSTIMVYTFFLVIVFHQKKKKKKLSIRC